MCLWKIPAFPGKASPTNCAGYVRVGVMALTVRGIPETTPLSSKHFTEAGLAPKIAPARAAADDKAHYLGHVLGPSWQIPL